jgi:ABC-2 type transport system permease protein
MRAFVKLTLAGLKSFTRDRAALFWSLFFPVFFIVIFGSIFGRDQRGSAPKFPIRIVMEDASPQVAWLPGVFDKVPVLESKTTDLATARRDLEKGDVRAVVVVPAGFAENMMNRTATEVKIYTDPGQQQIGSAVSGIIQQVLIGVEKRMSATPTLLRASDATFATTGSKGEDRRSKGIDFLLPGILAMTVMQLGLFTAIPIIMMREKGILKRLRATPLPRGTIVGSQVTQRLAISVFQTLVIIALGVLMFNFHMSGSWPALFGIVVFGVLTFISIGAVLASIAKTQESGISMVQLVNFPMMFLSGLFFPIEILPKFFSPIVRILPATYMADLLRNVMTGMPLHHSVAQCVAVMAAWLAGGLFIASRMFRWE